MNLVRWSPLVETNLLRNTMNRLFDTALQGPRAESENGAINCKPAVGFHESDNKVSVYVDLTGLDEPTVDVHVENNILRIRGECRVRQNYDKEGINGAQGVFARSFILATAVDPANVCTTCKDGVLTITLPKAKTITITKMIEVAGAAAA